MTRQDKTARQDNHIGKDNDKRQERPRQDTTRQARHEHKGKRKDDDDRTR